VSAVLFVVCAPAGVLVRGRCCECGLSSLGLTVLVGVQCALAFFFAGISHTGGVL